MTTRIVHVVEVYCTRTGVLLGRPEFPSAAEAAVFVANFADDEDRYHLEELEPRPAGTW